MRHLHFYLFGFTALGTACQQVTPTIVNSKATPAITVAAEDQIEIDLVVSTITNAADNDTGTDSGSDSGFGTNDSTEETVIAATPAAPPVQPPFRPKAMIGSASIILLRDLGIARMIRQEGPIEIWQYRFAACVVDFFFYPASQGSSQLIIKDWDMRSAVIGGRVNKGKCLAAMDRHHQKLVAGS
jgi:hypothetical protein